MRRPTRVLLSAAGLVIAVAGAASAVAPPRFTWVNDGLVVQYPWRVAAGAGLAALGLVAVASMLRPRALRALVLLLAVANLAFAASRGTYRVRAGPERVSRSGLFGDASIAWRDVARVEDASEAIVLHTASGQSLRVDCASFTPDERAALDRTIARRIRESSLQP
jgi:hypothetical protein